MRQQLMRPLVALVMMLAVSPIAFAAGDVAQGKEKAATCLGCHGIPSYTNVYPTYHVPKLGGQHEAYIAAALQGYKSGERGHKTMHAQALKLSDQDIADISAYFASLKP